MSEYMYTSTWRRKIEHAMKKHGETMADAVHSTASDEALDEEFDDNYGLPCGKPFTLWIENRVYFPVTYDGAESVASVPRAPCDEVVEHVGGY